MGWIKYGKSAKIGPTPAAAKNLRGESVFRAINRRGTRKRHDGALITRQYQQKGPRMSPELYRNLVWRYTALGDIEPRAAPP